MHLVGRELSGLNVASPSGFAAASAEAFSLARALSLHTPFAAGALIHQLYYAPAYQRLRHRRLDDQPARAREFLRSAREGGVDRPRGQVRTYRWGEDSKPAVLLVHGWTSQASDWLLPARALLHAGVTLVAYDHPAHGASDGLVTSLPDCVDALTRVLAAEGPFDAIVAHSGGGAIVATTLAGLLGPAPSSPGRLAVLAPPASLRATMTRFAAKHGFEGAAFKHFEARVDLENGERVDRFDVARALAFIPAKLLHVMATADEEIPRTESLGIRAALPAASFLDVSADHAGLLTSRTVAKSLLEFVNFGAEGAAKFPLAAVDKRVTD